MIDFLKGHIAHKEQEYVVIDVGGVGYRVFCTNAITYREQSGQQETFYIHYHVREDAVLLYGFPTRNEQALFRRLLDVTGIGPKVAIGMLSGCRPEEMVAAILQENIAFLIKLPGVGRKTAQRIILDLKDKLASFDIGQADFPTEPGTSAGGAAAFGTSPAWGEAKEALLALGYTDAEIDQSWHSIRTNVKETDNVDVLIKYALQALFNG